jgi:hypothetical protein
LGAVVIAVYVLDLVWMIEGKIRQKAQARAEWECQQ